MKSFILFSCWLSLSFGAAKPIVTVTLAPYAYAVEKIAVSPDGKEICYEETNNSWTSFRFKYYKYDNNAWIGPADLFNGFYCLSLAPDGNSMYFENHSYNDCWISARQPRRHRGHPTRRVEDHGTTEPRGGQWHVSMKAPTSDPTSN